MNQAITGSVTLATILLAAALIVVWARRKTWLRAGAIPMAIVAAVGGSFTMLSTLGFAVPLIAGLTAPSGEAPLLSAKLVVNEGIFITLDLPDVPRLYWLPWNKTLADELQEMLSNPDNGGVTATVPPFEFSWDQSPPSFQPLPQPKVLPDKPAEPKQTIPEFAA